MSDFPFGGIVGVTILRQADDLMRGGEYVSARVTWLSQISYARPGQTPDHVVRQMGHETYMDALGHVAGCIDGNYSVITDDYQMGRVDA